MHLKITSVKMSSYDVYTSQRQYCQIKIDQVPALLKALTLDVFNLIKR